MQFPRDHFQWINPADAIFVTACREALKIERAAYEAADAERRVLRARLEAAGDGRIAVSSAKVEPIAGLAP